MKLEKMDEKGQVTNVATSYVIAFGVLVLSVGLIVTVVGNFQATLPNPSAGLNTSTPADAPFNITNSLLVTIKDNVVFIGLLLLVGLAVLIIGMVKGFQGRGEY